MHSLRPRRPWRTGGAAARRLKHVGFSLRGTVTLVVVLLCVGAFLALALLDLTGVVPRGAAVHTLGLSYYGAFERGWLFQFATAPLLHASATHLAFNMLTLAFLGPAVERRLGRSRYIVFSALCAMVASVSQLAWHWGSPMVGAGYSGVVFGLLVAQASLFPNARVYIYAFFPVRMRHAAFILGAVELYFAVSGGSGGVGHIAHLGGAGAAFVYLKTVPCARGPGSVGCLRPLSLRVRSTGIPREL